MDLFRPDDFGPTYLFDFLTEENSHLIPLFSTGVFLSSHWIAGLLVLFIGYLLATRGEYRSAFLVFAGLSIGLLLAEAVRVAVPRPVSSFAVELEGFGGRLMQLGGTFPSASLFLSTFAWMSLFFTGKKLGWNRAATMGLFLAGCLVVFGGFLCNLFLGWHYLTDLLAGLAGGAGLAFLVWSRDRSPVRPQTLLLLVCLLSAGSVSASEKTLTPRLHHLRLGNEPEWSHFPKKAEDPALHLRFQAEPNDAEKTLRLRHQDVKQAWKLRLNGKDLARLRTDENDMIVYVPLPPGSLKKGENTLAVEQTGKVVDDIRIGEIILDSRPLATVLNEASVEVTVLEEGRPGSPAPLPCRITVVNADGALATVGAKSNDHLAVRPGVVYTGSGKARFGLPAGAYTIHAGRGFEYGIDSRRITVKPGDTARITLSIRREVPTDGYVASDTHVHTLTYSGHGDATVEEQVLTIAGEGIELPIATEHNRQMDYHPTAVKQRVRDYFTPVVGNEVTTAFGHFNIFPVKEGGPLPNFKLKDWKSTFESIDRTTGARVVILNHPRDVHSRFRPFAPARHLALTGEDLDGWALKANGVEVVNSGAQQSDVMRLVRDWFGLLNRGLNITPVGSSDSHDVARHFVGQGRTYIRGRDDNPGAIDVDDAVENFRKGRVMVSCGLLAEMTVNGEYGPGDLVPSSRELTVAIRVLGPSWVKADRVELYANGYKVREEKITGDAGKLGVKWEGTWKLPAYRHDVHLVAVATGPGTTELYWPIARPYQPTSPVLERRAIGLTGATWVDGDADGKKTSAFDYAVVQAARLHGDALKLIQSLSEYDEAVAAQAAGILQHRGISLHDPMIRQAARKAGAHVARGFEAFADAWRESQVARGDAFKEAK